MVKPHPLAQNVAVSCPTEKNRWMILHNKKSPALMEGGWLCFINGASGLSGKTGDAEDK